MSRAEAARINGAKSKGPITEAGKAVSSQNALHHGLNASQVVIPGEDPAEFEELLADLAATYGPATLVEFDLVSEMAAARWRLRRLPRMERAVFNTTCHRVQNEPDAADLTPEMLEMRVWNEVTNSPEMKQIHRYETRLRRAWEKGRVEIEALVIDRLRAERDEEASQHREPRPHLVQNEPVDCTATLAPNAPASAPSHPAPATLAANAPASTPLHPAPPSLTANAPASAPFHAAPPTPAANAPAPAPCHPAPPTLAANAPAPAPSHPAPATPAANAPAPALLHPAPPTLAANAPAPALLHPAPAIPAANAPAPTPRPQRPDRAA